MNAPLSVIIPALNAQANLPACLEALVEGAVSDLIGEVLLVDGGSSDATPQIAEAAGCHVHLAPRGRARQLIAGAGTARGTWLLFLHADTVLSPGWSQDVDDHMAGHPGKAAFFQLAFDADCSEARWLAGRANQRARWFGLPYGDQGLLVSRELYDAVGGFPDIALMEDVALVRRIGKRRLRGLASVATTSAAKYERDGWRRRSWRNAWLLARYLAGADPAKLAREYT
jgi:rSAM/selenodomain-associated transferase 2